MTTVYVRGQTVTITATFSAAPEDPVLHYAYQQDGETVLGEVDMTENSDGEWQAVIDTSPAEDGIVYWTIRATGIAQEGNFRLVANPANPTNPVSA